MASIPVGGGQWGRVEWVWVWVGLRQWVGNELVVTASEGEQVEVQVLQVDLRARRFSLR